MIKTYEETLNKLLNAYHDTNSGHIGGGISILPALYSLLSGPFSPDEDYIVFSKGHCVAALYAALNSTGYISDELFATFYQDGSKLGAHTPSHLTRFIPFATGSLGHGPSLANGLALSKKLRCESGRIYCFCGDGEWQEGTCWEALTFAVQHNLNNVTIVIDCNGWQGFGAVNEVSGIGIDGMQSRLSAFGANVIVSEDNSSLSLSKLLFNQISNVPTFILLKTTKGLGLLEYEDTLASHYIQLNDDLYDRVMSARRNKP